jgi:hypothetical protein
MRQSVQDRRSVEIGNSPEGGPDLRKSPPLVRWVKRVKISDKSFKRWVRWRDRNLGFLSRHSIVPSGLRRNIVAEEFPDETLAQRGDPEVLE